MFFIDKNGNVQEIPKVCMINTKQKNIYLIREKYGLHK